MKNNSEIYTLKELMECPNVFLKQIETRDKKIEELKTVLKDLIDRVHRNGGLGEYKGGKAFVLTDAARLLK